MATDLGMPSGGLTIQREKAANISSRRHRLGIAAGRQPSLRGVRRFSGTFRNSMTDAFDALLKTVRCLLDSVTCSA